MAEQPVLLSAWGDTHTGSSEGLMMPKQYQFKDGNVRPNPRQRVIWRRFAEYVDKIKRLRIDHKLVVVLNGDLVDGDHHNTHQLHTRKATEQMALFLDCWDYFAQEVGFGGDDQVYVIHGTEPTHGNPDTTDAIARDIDAVPWQPPSEEGGRDGWYPWQDLQLDIHGQLVRFTHHPPAGLGRRAHTKGNAIRGWLRSHQVELLARRQLIPRFVVWSHLHTAHAETVRLDDGTPTGPQTTGVILPAFQGKTDYVYRAIPMAQNTTIGGWWARFEPDMPVLHDFDCVELKLEARAVKV